MYVLNKVKELRWSQKLTVAELATRGGLRQSTVTKVENGDIIPSQITMMKISKGLGIPTHDVFLLDWHRVDLALELKREKK